MSNEKKAMKEMSPDRKKNGREKVDIAKAQSQPVRQAVNDHGLFSAG